MSRKVCEVSQRSMRQKSSRITAKMHKVTKERNSSIVSSSTLRVALMVVSISAKREPINGTVEKNPTQSLSSNTNSSNKLVRCSRGWKNRLLDLLYFAVKMKDVVQKFLKTHPEFTPPPLAYRSWLYARRQYEPLVSKSYDGRVFVAIFREEIVARRVILYFRRGENCNRAVRNKFTYVWIIFCGIRWKIFRFQLTSYSPKRR